MGTARRQAASIDGLCTNLIRFVVIAENPAVPIGNKASGWVEGHVRDGFPSVTYCPDHQATLDGHRLICWNRIRSRPQFKDRNVVQGASLFQCTHSQFSCGGSKV